MQQNEMWDLCNSIANKIYLKQKDDINLNDLERILISDMKESFVDGVIYIMIFGK